ncbi:MAG TPA: ethanolamine ammonia-lyase subunit EutB [Candidatus Angelobacter sp.]|jgi:ethanolamine ammonia-lyase large subunit|nr:ethanolamine ammonia-lyase subunit EutB [Candidatus Angelobacter sp.]
MHQRFQFGSLKELFAKANEEKSGDTLAGIAAGSERERVAAKRMLADTPLETIVSNPLIEPEHDDVTQLILRSHDQQAFARIKSLTVGELREFILDDATGENDLRQLHWAITPEMAAAVAKIMSNKDLIIAAAKIRVVTHCRNTMGQRGVLGIRLQPNHPADDIAGILLSSFDGLLYGCGDAVVGVNPATDSVETVSAILHALQRLIDAYNIPTQACCLAHVSTQLAALDRGAPVDLLFQSIAGTQQANESFGVSLAMLREGQERVLEHHKERGLSTQRSAVSLQPLSIADGRSPNHRISRSPDHNVMYFETGQGSALSADAHHGVDQLTLEARAYGVARVFHPFLVNTVVGFIGPEYLYDERQIIRAGLEDHFMGKLLGLPMGCDVCYTNHAAADQNSADNLLVLLAAAGCNYFMGVPCADDVMLNYQSTSFHDALAVRKLFNLRPAPEFHAWLQRMGIFDGDQPAQLDEERRKLLSAGMELALKT